MNISSSEASEALEAIQKMMRKTKRTLSSSGGYQFFILWGAIWLIGFLSSQFIKNEFAGYIWAGLDTLGGLLSAFIGIRIGRTTRKDSTSPSIRFGAFWWLLMMLCGLAILVVWPIDWKQVAILITLFAMIGWIAFGLLLSAGSVKLALAIIVLALVGYYLLPDFFYLLMAILGGGGMIAFGLFIQSRW
jgi:hypothetical protein